MTRQNLISLQRSGHQLPVVALSVLLLFLSLAVVSAAPPFAQTSDTAMQIEYPKITVIKQGSPYEFSIHVINDTNRLTNKTVQCFLHLYDHIGSHIRYGNTSMQFDDSPQYGLDFYKVVSGKNFTSIGTYAYVIECNSTAQVAFVSGIIEVTPSGFTSTLGFYIILMSIIVLMVILGFSFKEEWFVVLGGMGSIMLGIYSINYGVAGFKDMFMTWGVGLFEIAVGTIMALIASYSKME